MIKVTIILIILAVIAKVAARLVGGSMSVNETIVAQIHSRYPLRVLLSCIIFWILSISAVICLIVTIVNW